MCVSHSLRVVVVDDDVVVVWIVNMAVMIQIILVNGTNVVIIMTVMIVIVLNMDTVVVRTVRASTSLSSRSLRSENRT